MEDGKKEFYQGQAADFTLGVGGRREEELPLWSSADLWAPPRFQRSQSCCPSPELVTGRILDPNSGFLWLAPMPSPTLNLFSSAL